MASFSSNVYIWVNGREWLCQELSAAGIGFRRQDNGLVDGADFQTAQHLLEAQPGTNWPAHLNRLLPQACPAFSQFSDQGRPFERYWSADDAEWATDTLFRSSATLEERYPELVPYAISQASNMRYLAALAAAESPEPLAKTIDSISTAVTYKGYRARGLHLLTGPDAKLAAILLRGEFALNGFRNRDIRSLLFPQAKTAIERRRASGKVTRLIRLFRAHGLIRKITGTQRYLLTKKASQLLPACLAARNASSEKLNKLATENLLTTTKF